MLKRVCIAFKNKMMVGFIITLSVVLDPVGGDSRNIESIQWEDD